MAKYTVIALATIFFSVSSMAMDWEIPAATGLSHIDTFNIEQVINKAASGDRVIFDAKSPYKIDRTISIRNKSNIVIEGNNAQIHFTGEHGFLELHSVSHSRIQNFILDALNPAVIEGRIVNTTESHILLLLKQNYGSFEPGMNVPVHEVNRIDWSEKSYVFGGWALHLNGTQARVLQKNLLRVPLTADQRLQAGDRVGVGDSISIKLFDNKTTIDIAESENILFENILAHRVNGMFIRGVRNKDIRINKAVLKPQSSDYFVTSPRDGFHFKNTKGYLIIENSEVQNMNDDGININTFGFQIAEISGDRKTIRLKAAKASLSHIFDPSFLPRVSDELMVDRRNKRDFSDRYFVAAAGYQGGEERYGEIKLTRPLGPEYLPGDIVFNRSEQPTKIEIRNTKILNNRARGIVLQNGNALIDNVIIEGSTGAGIYVTNLIHNWGEGGDTSNIVIKESRLSRLNFGIGRQAGAITVMDLFYDGEREQIWNWPSTKNIRLEKNYISQVWGSAVFIASAAQSKLESNHFVGNLYSSVLTCGRINRHPALAVNLVANTSIDGEQLLESPQKCTYPVNLDRDDVLIAKKYIDYMGLNLPLTSQIRAWRGHPRLHWKGGIEESMASYLNSNGQSRSDFIRRNWKRAFYSDIPQAELSDAWVKPQLRSAEEATKIYIETML